MAIRGYGARRKWWTGRELTPPTPGFSVPSSRSHPSPRARSQSAADAPHDGERRVRRRLRLSCADATLWRDLHRAPLEVSNTWNVVEQLITQRSLVQIQPPQPGRSPRNHGVPRASCSPWRVLLYVSRCDERAPMRHVPLSASSPLALVPATTVVDRSRTLSRLVRGLCTKAPATVSSLCSGSWSCC
jgi:hypothetical protein